VWGFVFFIFVFLSVILVAHRQEHVLDYVPKSGNEGEQQLRVTVTVRCECRAYLDSSVFAQFDIVNEKKVRGRMTCRAPGDGDAH
jgi:hypothetical protein